MREINLRSGSKSGASSSSRTGSRSVSKKCSDTSKPVMLTLVFLVLAVLILGVSVVFGAVYSEKMRKANMVNLDDSKYYAVFLSNGQVYFGQLTSYNTNNPRLSDIYYLQLAQSPQAATEGQQATENTEAAEGESSETNVHHLASFSHPQPPHPQQRKDIYKAPPHSSSVIPHGTQ